MRRLLAVLAIGACAALAADISGNWKATAEGPNGSMERTFTFKVEGNKVTGETTSSMLGKSTITDGKVEGDTVTFSITADFGGNQMKIDYKGKISGDEIKFTSTSSAGGGQSIEWVAKRQ
ncbi:MAG TPA: hypothetical protein VME43_18610 [Bryobacteraceae bacterium]|nr:hypothetical protein [Bryobacteraceae bacterium]